MIGAGCLLALLLLGVWLSLSLGSNNQIAWSDIWYGLTHRYVTPPAPNSGLPPLENEAGNTAATIIQTLRAPRTVLALVVGAALGVSGGLIQGHTRNPIADPGLLGVSAGAALAVAAAVAFFNVTSPTGYVWFALFGAAAASIVVFGLAAVGGGGATPLTLVLAGWGVSAFLGSMTTAITLNNQTALQFLTFWNAGSVAGRDLSVFWAVFPFLVVGLALSFVSGPTLNLLNLGEDVARGLGVNIGAQRLLGLIALTLLIGAATAACGPIALVGLIVPHIVRAIVGPDYRWLLPYSALLGGILVVLCDVLGRTIARPGEIQVGIILASACTPFFVLLVRYRKLAQV